MSDRPGGWTIAKVGDIAAAISYGYTAKSSTSAIGPRYLRITDIQNGAVSWDCVPFCAISPAESKNYQLAEGDIVFARTGATTGKSFLITTCPDAVFASYLIRVRTSALVRPDFLSFFFQSRAYWDQITENLSGSAQPNCNASKLSSLVVPLPPIAEQQRIAAKVSTLLDRVRASEERLEKVSRILRRFRQAVLAAASSGRLTTDWRVTQELADAADTLAKVSQRRLHAARTPAERSRIEASLAGLEESESSELPKGWRFVQLAKIAESFDYGTSAKSKPSGSVPVLRMGNIQDGRIDWDDLVYTSNKEEIKSYALAPRTVLFNRTNSPELVGKTAIYRGEKPAIFAGYLIRVNTTPELDPEYLNLCLNTPAAREFCRRVKTDGVSQSNINAQKLRTFEVPFCDLLEQQEIVRRVEALFAFADRLESRLKKATAQVEQLTQSILAKAFRGELVSTEAELADAEGRTFESAADLLNRIANASADPPKAKTKRAKRTAKV